MQLRHPFVERAFCQLRQYRAVATRYDKRDFVWRGTGDVYRSGSGSGTPRTYGLDIIASEATLRLALGPDFTLSGVRRGQPVARRAASHPFERSVRRFLGAVSEHDPAAVACTPPDAAATLAVATAAERALQTSRAIRVLTL